MATGLGLLSTIGALAACSSAEQSAATPTTAVASPASSTPAAQPVPGIKVAVPPAADQVVPRLVAFDPCFRVRDSLIDRVGFDPGSRERYVAEVTSMTTLTHIGCTFRRVALVDGVEAFTGSLSITTNTDKVAEFGDSKRNQVIGTDPINGRPAVVYRSPAAIPTCDAAVEAPDGTLLISLTVPPAPVPVPEACSQIREIATVIASALDG
ncbi:DUF3558 domain-containing protein [Nocardia sp. NPDC060256]|uniref:DUF3558 domain-containing protein n=1 Tax=unclassified Nocardia TaxID=2637762 RepID=UPI00364BA403